jgi:dienelactone hydrolase
MTGGVPPEADPRPFRERSPIHYAGDIKVPVLFIVGAQDWVNPSYHCTDMADALRSAGNQDVSVEIIDEVEHFFCQRHFLGYRFDAVTGPALGWLDRYVKEG